MYKKKYQKEVIYNKYYWSFVIKLSNESESIQIFKKWYRVGLSRVQRVYAIGPCLVTFG